MQASDLIKVTGQHLLFLGVDSYTWTPAQFGEAAQFAHAHGVDTLLVKVADGGNVWYGGMDGWHAIRSAVLAQGVGAIPYTYSYGNKFGALDTEIDILISYMQDSGVVCADMEEEWNGQVSWAQHLASRIQPVAGTFLCSTWANPSGQDWTGIIQALAPCTDAFMPQQYTNYLAGFWPEFGANGATWIQPTVMLSQDFGPNNWVAIAQAAHEQQHTAISVWYYDLATANPAALDAVFTAFPKSSTIETQGDTNVKIDLSTPGVGQYFEAAGAMWKCRQTGFIVGNAHLDFYQSFGGRDLCGLTYLGLPLSNETDMGDGCTKVYYERGVAVYDPSRKKDGPPAASGMCYLAHTGLPKLEQDNVALQAKANNQQQSITALQGQVQLLQSGKPLEDLKTRLKQINSLSTIF